MRFALYLPIPLSCALVFSNKNVGVGCNCIGNNRVSDLSRRPPMLSERISVPEATFAKWRMIENEYAISYLVGGKPVRDTTKRGGLQFPCERGRDYDFECLFILA